MAFKASSNWNLSMASVVLVISRSSSAESQRSTCPESASYGAIRGRENRNMDQSFCWNLLAAVISFHWNGMSFPGLPPIAAHWRRASAPLLSNTSSGRMKLFRDLDILWPSSPNAMPLIRMASQGLIPSRALVLRMV